MGMTNLRVVGVVGLIMFTSLFVHCLSQVRTFLKEEVHKTKIYEKIKLRFHIVFACNALLEWVAALSQSLGYEYSRWGYIAHLLGLFANLVLFVTVIFMWNHVLASQNLIQVKWKYYAAFLGINFISTLLEVGTYGYYGDTDEFTTLQDVVNFSANILYVLSLFVSTIMILVVADRMKRKLTPESSGNSSSNSSSSSSSGGASDTATRQSSTTSSKASARATHKLLHKINMCLLLCLLSYSVRIYFIGRLTVVWMLTGVEPGFDQFSQLWWTVLTFWLPTLAPGILFLYVMRPSSARARDQDKQQMSAALSEAPPSGQVYHYDLEDNSPAERSESSSAEINISRNSSRDSSCQSFSMDSTRDALGGRGGHEAGPGEGRGRGRGHRDTDSLEGCSEGGRETEEDMPDRMTFFSTDNDFQMAGYN